MKWIPPADAFGVDCTGQPCNPDTKSSTVKSGKTAKVEGAAWSDHEVKPEKRAYRK